MGQSMQRPAALRGGSASTTSANHLAHSVPEILMKSAHHVNKLQHLRLRGGAGRREWKEQQYERLRDYDWTFSGTSQHEDDLDRINDKVRASWRRKEIEEARDLMQNGAECFDPQFLHAQALRLYGEEPNNFQPVESLLRKALLLNASFVPALLDYGCLLAKERMAYSFADGIFQRALRAEPLNYEVSRKYGEFLHYHAGNTFAAKQAYEQALDLNSSDPETLFHLALIAKDLDDDTAKADSLFIQALELNPMDPKLLATYGYFQMKNLQNRSTQGEGLINFALMLDPNNTHAQKLERMIHSENLMSLAESDGKMLRRATDPDFWVKRLDPVNETEVSGETEARSLNMAEAKSILQECDSMDSSELQHRLDKATRPDWLQEGPAMDVSLQPDPAL